MGDSNEFSRTVEASLNSTEIPGWLKNELDHGQVIRKSSVKRNKPKLKINAPSKGGVAVKHNRLNKKTQSYAELNERKEMESMKKQMHQMAQQLEHYRRTENEFSNMKTELQDQKQQNQMMQELLQHFMKTNSQGVINADSEDGIMEHTSRSKRGSSDKKSNSLNFS